MLQYYNIKCKIVAILFYLLIIQLVVYKRTITRFIADDKVVYQRVRGRCDWLQTTAEHDVVWNIWAGDRGEIHVDTWMENGSFVRNLTADRCLFGLSTWLSTKSSTATRRTRSTAACSAGQCTRLADSLQQTVDASKFPTLVRQFTQQPLYTILLWQTEICN